MYNRKLEKHYLSFYCNIQIVCPEFGICNMKVWIILHWINESWSWWLWWCNVIGNICVAYIRALNTNKRLLKYCNLSRYCRSTIYLTLILWCTQPLSLAIDNVLPTFSSYPTQLRMKIILKMSPLQNFYVKNFVFLISTLN